MLGAQLDLRAELPAQQFSAIHRVQAAPAARVQGMVGTGYTQQKMPRKVDTHQRDIQATGQFQCQQGQGQGLSAPTLQHLVEQSRLWPHGVVFVLMKTQCR
ncbi:hypothetical protein D3C76_1220490 [compost metagenome]